MAMMIDPKIGVMAEAMSRYISGAYAGEEEECAREMLKVLNENGFSLVQPSNETQAIYVTPGSTEAYYSGDKNPFERIPPK
jgi:hypothetical protein